MQRQPKWFTVLAYDCRQNFLYQQNNRPTRNSQIVCENEWTILDDIRKENFYVPRFRNFAVRFRMPRCNRRSTTNIIRRPLSGYTAWGENFHHTDEGQNRESLCRSPKTRFHRFGRCRTTRKERRNLRHVFTWENLMAAKQRVSATKRGRRFPDRFQAGLN